MPAVLASLVQARGGSAVECAQPLDCCCPGNELIEWLRAGDRHPQALPCLKRCLTCVVYEPVQTDIRSSGPCQTAAI